MRIIAVDDEPLQLETITEYITEFYPAAEVIGFTKVSQAIAYTESKAVDVAVLDISLPGSVNGIGLGELLRKRNARVKILYCTGYSEYAMDAFKIHANGYLQKPIQKDDLKRELQYILQMPVFDAEEKPYIQTFGNFDMFLKGEPVSIQRSKAKEILAYLTDKKGAWVSNRELTANLFEESTSDLTSSKYTASLIRYLVVDLENAGCSHIIERRRGKLRLLVKEVSCDYYGYLHGDEAAKGAFCGEYMAQYSWGEVTLAMLLQDTHERK